MRDVSYNKIIKVIVIEVIILSCLSAFYILLYHIFPNYTVLQHLPSGAFYLKMLFILALLALVYDLGIIFEKWTSNNLLVVYSIILIAVFTSLPIFMNGISHQQDLNYHLVRIQTMTDAIKSGQFPVRLNSGWMGGYGYPNAIFYGNFLLYIPVLFEILGFPLYQAYEIYIFSINLITAIFAYACVYYISRDKSISIAAAFAYSSVPFRLTLIYSHEFVGFYSGITFFPLIGLAIYMIYNSDLSNRRSKVISSLVLALGMSGLIGTHILSTLMSVMVIIIVALILFKNTFSKNVISTYAIAVAETLGLSCYFLVPFLDYYFTVPTAAKDTLGESIFRHIQASGVSLLQIFGYGIETHGSISRDIENNEIITYNYSLGLVYIILLIICAGLIISKKATKSIKITFYITLSFIWLSSCYFPWDYLTDNFAIFRILTTVQFAWRYMAISCAMLLILMGLVINRCSELLKCDKIHSKLLINSICGFFVILCMSICCNYASDYAKDAFVFYFDSGAIETYELISGEYLLMGSVAGKDNLDHEPSASSDVTITTASQNGCSYSLECSNASDSNGWIEVPMFNYKGYQALDSNNNRLKIVNGGNNVIRVIIPGEYSGAVDIDFKEPFYWRLSELVTLSTIIILLFILFKNGIKKHFNGQ